MTDLLIRVGIAVVKATAGNSVSVSVPSRGYLYIY